MDILRLRPWFFVYKITELLFIAEMADQARIAIVDDDPGLRGAISLYLSEEGYDVTEFHSGEELLKGLLKYQPDLVIVDGILPGIDGFHLTQTLRQAYNIGIIILTARSDITDRVVGLEKGADDYVTKPFANRELLIRIRNVLNARRPVSEKPVADTGEPIPNRWNLHREKRELITPQGNSVPLTSAEYELLLVFISQEVKKPLSREEIVERWKGDVAITESTVDVTLSRIRIKAFKTGVEDFFIRPVRSKGYQCVTVIYNV